MRADETFVDLQDDNLFATDLSLCLEYTSLIHRHFQALTSTILKLPSSSSFSAVELVEAFDPAELDLLHETAEVLDLAGIDSQTDLAELSHPAVLD